MWKKTKNFSAEIHKELVCRITKERLEEIKKIVPFNVRDDYEHKLLSNANNNVWSDEKLKRLKLYENFISRDESCENCYYAVFFGGCNYGAGIQLCYRYPPKEIHEFCDKDCLSENKGINGGCRCGGWWQNRPIVNDYDWCGEWKVKQEKK